MIGGRRSQRSVLGDEDGGFLAREKLDAELIYIPSSSIMAQAQVAGDVQISTANSQVIVDAGLRGSDLVAIGAITNRRILHYGGPRFRR